MHDRKSKQTSHNYILALNRGSSSVKFCLYQSDKSLKKILSGKIDRIGRADSSLTFEDQIHGDSGSHNLDVSDQKAAANFLLDWLEDRVEFDSVGGAGHRLVFGMNYKEPQLITDELMEELKRFSPYDPDHLPGEIELAKAFRKRHPQLPQVACFDTAFHDTMPRRAKLIPIPRHFEKANVRRYGFHGLSYSYLIQELARVAGAGAANGRLILAHLGSGASLAAVKDGKSIDTSMGFTPSSGLPMGTRSGDLDPGVAWYLMTSEKLTPSEYYNIINNESGLLGISGLSSDMRDLLNRQDDNVAVAEAVEFFCYQVRKWIGSFAAALGGLDTLVFSGGIGESSAEIRRRICSGLDFLGIELDNSRNKNNDDVISPDSSRVVVRVIPTDEELMIAKSAREIINSKIRKVSYHESNKK
jgi:acetate kinase